MTCTTNFSWKVPWKAMLHAKCSGKSFTIVGSPSGGRSPFFPQRLPEPSTSLLPDTQNSK